MKLSMNKTVRQEGNGLLEIAYVNGLPHTAIKHDREGKYFIETNGIVGTKRFDSPEKALEELERLHSCQCSEPTNTP